LCKVILSANLQVEDDAALNRPRILLGENNRLMLQAEIALLSSHFDVVGTATDGAELVSEAQRLHPDVIVTDISMPIFNGIDVVHRLRESGSEAKFVFVSVHTEQELAEACMEVGAFAYVQKPRMKHHLVPAIQAALAGRTYPS
jgi:DNA-binding NarL/FixJ family response regulator